jgi:hypothetical protein
MKYEIAHNINILKLAFYYFPIYSERLDGILDLCITTRKLFPKLIRVSAWEKSRKYGDKSELY